MKYIDISRLMILGFPGTELTEDVKTFIKKYRPGGFIFFADNFLTLAQADRLVHSVLDFSFKTHHFIPWLSIDHENKTNMRLPSPITPFPDAPTLGKVLNKTTATVMGRTMGLELSDLGFNLNFAPVCDILTPQTPTYLQRRCFSSNPEVVATVVENFIAGMQSQGVFSCAKHFPGLGSADKDPHRVLVSTQRFLKEFQDKDWLPFERAIAAGVKFIMTSHVLCENLDPNNMATYSKNIVQERLVHELHFDGVIVCDDIRMGAIKEDLVHCTVRALSSGHHLIINSERHCMTNAQFLDKLQQHIDSHSSLNHHIQAAIQKSCNLKSGPINK